MPLCTEPAYEITIDRRIAETRTGPTPALSSGLFNDARESLHVKRLIVHEKHLTYILSEIKAETSQA